MRFRSKNFIAVVLPVLAVFLFSGCLTPDDCPAGWVRNSTGDCVDIDSIGGGEDGDKVLDPCPEGWQLGADGFCISLTDGDAADGDRPADGDLDGDGDTEQPPVDGDTSVDGDTEQPVERTCASDDECLQGERCHFLDEGEGVCMMKCTSSGFCRNYHDPAYCNNEQRCVGAKRPETCGADSVCEYQTVCHTQANCGEGVCFAECRQDSHCNTLFSDLTCPGADGDGESDAENGAITEWFCSGARRCVPGTPSSGACTDDNDCGGDTPKCHDELNAGDGQCLAACTSDNFCHNYEADFICNTEQRCIAPRETCFSDSDCPQSTVCHTALGSCFSECTASAECVNEFGSEYWCNSASRCDFKKDGLSCSVSTDCSVGNVCHPLADSDGVCSPVCAETQDCLTRIGPGLVCNANNRCIPGDPPVDGDEDVDPDADPDIEQPLDPCETDTSCQSQNRLCTSVGDQVVCGACLPGYHEESGSCVSCWQVGQGSVLSVDVATMNLDVTAYANGAVFEDPYSSNNHIYLRDNSSGSMFKIHSAFSDGGALETVQVIRGFYNVWVENRFGQRKEVLNGVNLTGDYASLDVDFPFHKVSVTINKNSGVFPSLPPEFQGEMILYDSRVRRSHTLGVTGGGASGYSIDVFAGSYDIIFDGYLSANENSYQRQTLISGDDVDGNRQYSFNLETVTISGNIDVVGAPAPDNDGFYGEIWLIGVMGNDRFAFWSIDSLDAVSYNRELLAGSYVLTYMPPGVSNGSYLARLGRTVDWEASQGGVAIDVPLVHFTGDVTWLGGPLYELYDDVENTYIPRGDIYLIDAATGEKFHFLELGEQGTPGFDAWIPPSTYDYYFEGRLLSDAYWLTHGYPSPVHKRTFATDVDLKVDRMQDIDLPVVEIGGTVSVTYAGSLVSDYSAAMGDYLTAKTGSYDTPIARFGRLPASHEYQALLFPAVYEFRYYGSSLLRVFQNNILDPRPNDGSPDDPSVIVSASNDTFDFDIETVELGVTITINQGAKTLYDLLQDGTFDSADIRVANEISRLQMSTSVDDTGRFTIHRPTGEISLYLYLYKGNSYQIYPLNPNPDSDDYMLTGPDELTFDLPMVTLAMEVLKNGQMLPDSQNGSYSRGNLFFKSRDTGVWQLEVRFDLGRTGDTFDYMTMKEGDYSVNLSVGYGLPFDFMQWVYLGCVDVKR